MSVEVAAEKTGFTTGQVRGVILAPVLKAKFAKKEIDGVMHYKYEDESK